MRMALVNTLSDVLPIYIVNEFPKSGGTWISHMLSDALGVEFRDNQMPRIEKSLIKGHFLHKRNMSNLVTVWRDGRDVLVSFYYHSYFKFRDLPFNHDYVDLMRSVYPFDDYEDIYNNLPKFIEQQFLDPIAPSYTWTEFVDSWLDDKDSIHVRFEDIRANPVSELRRIYQSLTGQVLDVRRAEEIVHAHSIEKIKKNRSDFQDNHHFVRKGKVGGWKENFSPEAIEVFDAFAGEALEKAGYNRSSYRDVPLRNSKHRH